MEAKFELPVVPEEYPSPRAYVKRKSSSESINMLVFIINPFRENVLQFIF